MAAEYENTDAFSGATFTTADFSGATFRDCDMSRLKVVDSWLVDVNISGHIGNFVVNDVEVTAYVQAELDRRHPERVQIRDMKTSKDFQAAWRLLEGLWAETIARAERFPEPVRQHGVDGEWSLVETLRHLIFATDAWASSTILDDPKPFHRLGFTHTSYPQPDAAALGIELDAHPSYAEVMAVRAERLALVRGIVNGLTGAELERTVLRPPAPGYEVKPRTVGACLRVVMNEECEHRRYMERDLAVLEAREPA